jgi:hypothetical protein
MDDPEAGADTLDIDQWRQPDRAVAVQLNGTAAGRRDEMRGQLPNGVGRQQPAGILEVEAIDVSAVGQVGDALRVVPVGVDLAD